MSPAAASPLVRGWEVVIGLETHAQLSTQSKIFSGASTRFGAAPNTQACAVDLALPGTLPVMNRGAVERAIRFGLAVQATVAPLSIFARKNYFYPDLPKGYQISQYEIPVVQGGRIDFLLEAHDSSRARLQRHQRSQRRGGAHFGACLEHVAGENERDDDDDGFVVHVGHDTARCEEAGRQCRHQRVQKRGERPYTHERVHVGRTMTQCRPCSRVEVAPRPQHHPQRCHQQRQRERATGHRV